MQLRATGDSPIANASSTAARTYPSPTELDALLEHGSRLRSSRTLVFASEGLIYRATPPSAGCDETARWVIRCTEDDVHHDYLAVAVEVVGGMQAMDQATNRSAVVQRLPSWGDERSASILPTKRAPARDYRGGGPFDWHAVSTKTVLVTEAMQAAGRLATTPGRVPIIVDPLISGRYDGAVLWTNEGHLVQRVAGTTVIHELSVLTICKYCRLRPRRTVRVSYDDGRGFVCSSERHEEPSRAALRSVVVTSTGTTDVTGPEFAALRHRGFAEHATELAVRLMSSSVARSALARLVRRLRTEGRLSFHADASRSHADVDAVLLADVVRCRYAAWLGRHATVLST